MDAALLTWPNLVAELQFAGTPTGHATGVIGGLAATLTPLAVDPLAVMCQFRLRADDEQLAVARPLFASLSTAGLDVHLSADEARLACLQLAGQTPQSVHGTLIEFAQALAATNLVTPDACLRCGATEDVRPVFHQGETSLVCGPCLEAATADWQERQAKLDRSSLSALVGLPAVFTFSAAGWAAFWTVIDLAIIGFRVQVIEINKFTILLTLIAVGIVGACLGFPLGTLLRRSGAIRRAPEVLAGLIVAGAAAAGELLYVGVLIFRNAGIVDLGLAAQLLPIVLQGYHSYWVVTKLALAFAIGLFCVMEARQRPEARLEL